MPGFDNNTCYAGLLTLDGIGTGTQNVVDITPALAIGGTVDWRGVYIDGSNIDPTGAGSTVYGIEIDLSGTSQTNNPDLHGIELIMPAVAGSEGCDAALHAQGYGFEAVILCDERLAGFWTDQNLHLDLDIGAFTAVDTGYGQIFNVTNLGSTGGDFHCVDAYVTGAGTADVVALGANPGVVPIHHHAGTFGAVDQGWKETAGPAYTDTTAQFDNPAVNVTIFDNDNDYIYIGTNAAFNQVRVILNTPATRGIIPIFEYSTIGPVWVPFSPIDGTDGFTQDGVIAFDDTALAGWAAVTVNGGNYFYIRIQRTRNNIGTIPIEETIRISDTTLYYWDASGDVVVNSITGALADTSGVQNAVVYFGASGALTGLGPLTNGQLVIGSTGNPPVAGTLTDPAAGFTITEGAGTITFALADDLAGIEALATTGIVSRTAADTYAATTVTQHAVLIGDAGELPAMLGPLTNGQLVIGNTGNAPSAATLTAGTGVGITNGAGTVTINATGGGLTWNSVAVNGTIAINNGYLCTGGAALSYALPAASAIGDVAAIGLDGSTSWTITQGAGQQIRIGNQTTTAGAGGSLTSTAQGDIVHLVCVTANTTWLVTSSIGNITVV